MESLTRIFTVLTVPLIIINMFGSVASGIWLAILGEWGIIGYGILALAVAGWGIILAMIPGIVFEAPATIMIEKDIKFGGYLFGFLSCLYVMGVLVTWCVLVLIYYIKQANHDSMIPMLIWSYGIATGPIAWLAKKALQSDDEYALLVASWFIQVAYLLTILGILFAGMSLLNALILFGVIMAIGLVVQFSVTYLTGHE